MYLQKNWMKTWKKISDRAFQWKIIFNPDASKQAQEIKFSRKIKNPTNSPLVFNNDIVCQTKSRKTRGTLDFKLTLSSASSKCLLKS